MFGRGSAISSAQHGNLGGEEFLSCLALANVHAFHEIPNRIHTELTFINF